MKKRISLALTAALLTAVMLCACGRSVEAPKMQINSETGMKLTQESTVKREKYLDNADFEQFLSLAETGFIIPGLNQATIPQGICYSSLTDCIYISSYYAVDAPSVITAMSADTGELLAEYFLYNADGTAFNSHVGGIAESGGNIYLSAKTDANGNYTMAVIPLADLESGGSHDVTVKASISLPVSPSFINCSGGYLWVGNFYHPAEDYGLSKEINYTTNDFGCYIVAYSTERDLLAESGEGYPMPDFVIAAPNKIQGMNILTDGSILLSQSYGRRNNSSLLHYALNMSSEPDCSITIGKEMIACFVLSDDKLIDNISAMPMTEGMCVAKDGGTLILFESGAMKYKDGLYRTDKFWELDGIAK